MKEGFITPPNHVGFAAKNLFGASGRILDGAIAYLAPDGGGPTERHTHAHNHLFIVTQGEARIQYGDQTVILGPDESFLVRGAVPHAVWNNASGQTVMIGISVTE